MLRDT